MSELFGDLFDQDNITNDLFNDSIALPPPMRHPSKLAGLQNRSATCYLNSLLQVLYFTNDFRGNQRQKTTNHTSFLKIFRWNSLTLEKGPEYWSYG